MGTSVLVITGCIAPPKGVSDLVIARSEERLQQYRQCVQWAVEMTDFKNIVFCDNSNFAVQRDLVENAARKGKNLEWLSFQGDAARVAMQGKGYGEGEILQYIVKKSSLFAHAEFFCKLTGRLTVQNMKSFCRKAKPTGLYLWCNGLNKNKTVNAIDTRFYGMPTQMYTTHFAKAYQNVDDRNGRWLEHCFFTAFRNAELSATPIFFFPELRGKSGSMGVDYHLSAKVLLGKELTSGLGWYAP